MQKVQDSDMFPGRKYVKMGTGHRYRAFEQKLREEGYEWMFYDNYEKGTIVKDMKFIASYDNKSFTFWFENKKKAPETFENPDTAADYKRKVEFVENILKKYPNATLAKILNQEKEIRQFGKKVTVIEHKSLYDCVEERM